MGICRDIEGLGFKYPIFRYLGFCGNSNYDYNAGFEKVHDYRALGSLGQLLC